MCVFMYMCMSKNIMWPNILAILKKGSHETVCLSFEIYLLYFIFYIRKKGIKNTDIT